MGNFKTAIISVSVALVVLIATIIIVTSGRNGSGLYVSSVSGDVTLSRTDTGETAPLAADTFLSEGDVISVNGDGACTLIYRSKDNLDSNTIVLEPSSQVFVTGPFNGKDDGELYLNRGAVLVNSMEKCMAGVIVRTENTSVSTDEAVLRISYSNDDVNLTHIASFAGGSQILMYDLLGNAIDKDGEKNDSPEYLGEGLCGLVSSADSLPKFDYLNIPTDLSSFSAATLREILTFSAFHDLAFSAADIKAAYDNAYEDTADTTPPEETTTIFSETTVPESTSEETSSETTTTTAATTQQTTAATTKPPVTTTTAAATTTQNNDDRLITVYIFIEDEIITQEVPYGGDAVQPPDPVIPGKKFLGWDESFKNITSERTISAIFEDDNSEFVDTGDDTDYTTTTPYGEDPFSEYHTVTFNINGQLFVQTVKHGEDAVPPEVNVPGYEFIGWDRSPYNITEDIVITAILVPKSGDTTETSDNSEVNTYTVTFVIDGQFYPVTVKEGEDAVPPFIPTFNSQGQMFIGWDTNFTNVRCDLIVNAIFANV